MLQPRLRTPRLRPLQEALSFPAELALLAERHCAALRDFTGERPDPAALDLGCGVGGATFELAHAFPAVLGVDSSKYLINAAQVRRRCGRRAGPARPALAPCLGRAAASRAPGDLLTQSA